MSSATAQSGAVTLPLEDARWRAFVDGCPGAGPFHDPAWATLLSTCYGFHGFALAIADRDGNVRAGLPVADVSSPLARGRWVSLPFTDHCPPLAAGLADRAELERCLDGARRAGAARVLEVRDRLEHAAAFSSTAAVRHELALEDDPDAVFRRFHRSQVQRNIARSRREGVVVRRARAREDLTAVFYRLHLTTRRRQGVPIQPRRFFELLWDRIIERGLGFVSVAWVEEQPAAAAVFLAGGKTVVYKYGASDSRFLSRRPNHALFWDAIRWSCEQGFRAFDFGRTDLGNEGLRRFKSGFGAAELPLVVSMVSDELPTGGAGRGARLLEPVIRRSPPVVCRVLGELLYRYAA